MTVQSLSVGGSAIGRARSLFIGHPADEVLGFYGEDSAVTLTGKAGTGFVARFHRRGHQHRIGQDGRAWRTAIRFSGMYHPRGQIFFGMRPPLLLQRRQAKAVLEKIHSWRPDCVLLSHGRCFESHGDDVIRRIFGAAPS